MKNTIINKTINKAVIYITAMVLAVMIGNTVTAQGITTDENGMIAYKKPAHPENYLYLPSFKKWSFGLDFWNYTPWRIDDTTCTNAFPGHNFITSYGFFDSSYSRPTEAISQKFMIDSTITIHGVALYREFEVDDSSLFLDWCRIEDSIQIQSLNHDTVYRSMSIAHLRVVDTTRGIYEYYFAEPLTISKPFTVLKKFSREHYRRIREYRRVPQMFATESLVFNNPEYEFHSYQRPSIKHYGDSNWYEYIDDPYIENQNIYSVEGYTDLYMLPIYNKAPEPICSLSVQAKPEGYGTVSGSGNYDKLSYVTIQAFPNENYRFVCWENIPLCDNPLTIRVMSDTVFTAIFDTILPTEIDMAEINEGITIHPNPATTILNIELPNNLNCTAELRNIKGVLIDAKQLQGNAQWNIEALPPGVYLITFRNKDVSITRKFVKK
ncbi:MAG: T9SS type A sorting domain-containing protein [Bacteroidales bacterium]|nr:T9SS type A sorting domain-containing protein [Bacteroidales bacterium]